MQPNLNRIEHMRLDPKNFAYCDSFSSIRLSYDESIMFSRSILERIRQIRTLDAMEILETQQTKGHEINNG